MVIKFEKNINGNIAKDTQQVYIYHGESNYRASFTIWNFAVLDYDNFNSNFAYKIHNDSPAIDLLIDNIKTNG